MAGISSTSCSIFPLSLGRETELPACQCIELKNKLLTVIPGNIDYRLVRLAVPVAVREASHHFQPETCGNLSLCNLETAYSHLVNRFFILTGCLALLLCSAHLECTALDTYHGNHLVSDLDCLTPGDILTKRVLVDKGTSELLSNRNFRVHHNVESIERRLRIVLTNSPQSLLAGYLLGKISDFHRINGKFLGRGIHKGVRTHFHELLHNSTLSGKDSAFPLSLCRHRERYPGHLGELGNEFLTILIADHIYRQLR